MPLGIHTPLPNKNDIIARHHGNDQNGYGGTIPNHNHPANLVFPATPFSFSVYPPAPPGGA
jgi:hypothetical protein